MEAMTLSVVLLQRNKVAARLDEARRVHGTAGRGGGQGRRDTSSRVARLERQLSDWERLLKFAQGD